MSTSFTIDIENGARYYAFFYFLAFVVGLIILTIDGHKRKFPILPWLLMVATSFLFFVIGTEVVRWSPQDWARVAQFRELEHSVGRSVLGGILLALPALLLAKFALNFNYSVMDAFAWATPVGMLIQRFGCLLSGCCFGAPTSVPWGIQYGPESHAFNHHVQAGLISSASNASSSIHPVPIYEILGCFIIILLLEGFKKRLKAPGNLLLLSIALYGVVRFITEFFRSHAAGNVTPIGITVVQLIILVVLLLIVALIVSNERKHEKHHVIYKGVSNRFALTYFLLLAMLFFFFSRWLNRLEIISIGLVMIPTIFLIGWTFFKSITVPTLRLATGCFMVGSMFMMSQTLPERPSPDGARQSYFVLTAGTISGQSKFEYLDENYDCNGNGSSTLYRFNNSFKINGVGLAHAKQVENNRAVQIGVDGYWGKHKENVTANSSSIPQKSISVLGVRPYFQHDWPLVGFGLGVHVGNLAVFKRSDPDRTASSATSMHEIMAFPSAYFRVGYPHKVFGELRVAQQFPSPFPTTDFQTNIGFGLPGGSGGAIRIGTSSYAGVVISPTLPLGKNILLDATIAGFPGLNSNNSDYREVIEQKSCFVGSISMSYKMGRKLISKGGFTK